MDRSRRKELLEEYKKMKTYMGVIKITNEVNGMIYIASCPNLKNKWLAIQNQLDIGRHINSSLQLDWKKYGKEVFTFEVLEEKSTEDISDIAWELKQIEKKWLNHLQPYGEHGYNKSPQ